MLISLNWLNQYVDIKGKEIPELENALTMIGQEVEKIDNKYGHLDKVLTAKVVRYEKMEGSDHLTICQVDNGTEVLQVVCGAPNHKEGDIVAMAQVGAQLAPDFIIKKGKIRGHESNGMLCSLDELGLGEDKDGIIILPEDTPLGIPLNKYFDKDDIVFELEITPNRPDCLSYIGIARELSAYYHIDLKIPEVNIKEVEEKNNFKVSIQDSKLSNRYATRIIKNIKVGDSPKWLKDKIEAMGMKSINNIVDASNFVMFETGQPNHIFDLDKIGNSIEIRNANENEEFVTLDEKKLNLNIEDIVVSSEGKAIALAGVMGGLDSSVKENTKNILLECAHFDSITVRRTSRRHIISSDSSYRFERWVNTSTLDNAINRLAQIIVEVAGGDILEGISEEYLIKVETNKTTLNLEKMWKFIGKKIEKEKIINILEKLEVKVIDNGENLELEAPSFREDLVNAQDYYEEVIRMYGFDNIENVLPRLDIKKEMIVDNTYLNYKTKQLCQSLGLKEVINYSFIPKKALEMIKSEETRIIELENPITEDFAVMRPTIMYSLLKNAVDNFNRSFNEINFFEVSKTFIEGSEITKFAIILSGVKAKTIYSKEISYDFYDMKGIIEEILDKLGLKAYNLFRSENKSLHPGRSADVYVGKSLVGSFGQIHPDLDETFGIEGKNTIIAEFNLDEIAKYIKQKVKYKGISKYQSVTRDLAFVVNENLLVGNMIKSIEKLDKIIQRIDLFDVYKGPGIEEGKKSFAISILMRDDNKTLEEKEINSVVEKIKNKMFKEYSAEIRK